MHEKKTENEGGEGGKELAAWDMIDLQARQELVVMIIFLPIYMCLIFINFYIPPFFYMACSLMFKWTSGKIVVAALGLRLDCSFLLKYVLCSEERNQFKSLYNVCFS